MSDAQLEAALKVQPPEVEQEVVSIYAQARNRGLQSAAALLGGVSLLAFLLAFRLKAPAQSDGGESDDRSEDGWWRLGSEGKRSGVCSG